ncbi:MAG: adenylate cyclase [Thermoleophilaceae bacterium]|nr:adenylate cyclase [Thermoleophilaceae bacterium]
MVYESRGRHQLRNIGAQVELFAALRAVEHGEGSLAHDVVCQMAVDPQPAPGRLIHEDTVYYFCSLTCAGTFARDPDRFTPAREARP